MKRYIAAVFIATALATAAPAQADQYEYVSHLDNNGVYYADITEIIDIGKGICRSTRANDTPQSIDQVFSNLNAAGFAPAEVGIMAYGAAEYMCPDIHPALKGWAAWAQATRS